MEKQLNILLLCIFVICCLSANAQQDRITESEVKEERKFLDAYMPTLYERDGSEDAIKQINKVLDEDPTNDAALFALAKTYIKRGNNVKALEYANRAHRIDPDNRWYSVFMGRVYESMQRFAEAAEIYKELHNQFPENREYASNYAYFLLLSGQKKEALSVIEKTEENQGFDPDLSLKKIQILEALGRSQAIENEWSKLIEFNPENTDWMLNLSKHYLKEGKIDQARETLNEILQIDPENVKAQVVLADIQPQQGGNKSFSDLKKLIENPSQSLDIKVNALIPEMNLLHPDSTARNKRTIELARTLTEDYPQNAKSWSVLGDFYFNSGMTKEACNAFEKATELTKSVFSVWEQLLRCLDYTMQYDKLKSKADKALIYFPNRASIYYYLAVANVNSDNISSVNNNLAQSQIMAGKDYGLLQRITGLNAYVKTIESEDESAISKALESFKTAQKLTPQALLWILESYKFLNKTPNSNILELIRNKSLMKEQIMDKHYVLAEYHYQKQDYEDALKAIRQSYASSGRLRPKTALLYGNIHSKLNKAEKAQEWYIKAKNQGIPEQLIQDKIQELGL